ncbi:MAG: hypothetical protein KGJ88_11625 [Verrucomicrobiota bacterium]|nr:hypothetical protein [Verrucomicrobiota bacterium]
MNFDKLQQNVGARIRLRPPATRQKNAGIIEDVDDVWILESVSRNDGVKLHNVRTGHVVVLLEDHVHHFTSDPLPHDGLKHGFLELSVHVRLDPKGLKVEPILSGVARLGSKAS